ncbi:hypothetical protein SAMN06272735_8601 [Streptomyces sp. TLI_55]|uniref:hypothetical protein n=1 Tax=Streptomyces sp. TLI_55 TaxID=1938861 RepID=UPI000BCCD4A7|nr:hypothetical protein [Streptomyces sp. TLI_55]SNX88165.1 hypothetical protein SAMN06272735_8601 [Streptomyces sp. TLI_55]
MAKRTPRRTRKPRTKKDRKSRQSKRRLISIAWRAPGRGRRQRRDLQRHLLRGAAYSTGAGIVGLVFWWLRLRFHVV